MPKKKHSQPLLFDIEETAPQPNVPPIPPQTNNTPKTTTTGGTLQVLHPNRDPSGEEGTDPRPVGPLQPQDVVIAIDSHSLIYQVFHAMPTMTSPKGVPVNALYGFLRDLADLRDYWKPSFLVCTFDASGETFRNDKYPAYKEHRDPMPEDLRAQIPLIHEAIRCLGIPFLSLEGFEADDILATIVRETEQVGSRCILVTSDKDCRQLLSNKTQLFNLRKKELFGPEQLLEVWGIRPDQVVDFQAMVGDSSDNVPGVPTIGPKYAAELLQSFDSLENIYANLDRVPGAKRQEKLREFKEQAFLSQYLAQLRKDTPIALDWLKWRTTDCDAERTRQFFLEYGLKSLVDRLLITPPSPKVSTRSKPPYRIVRSLEQLEKEVKDAANAPLLSFDCETTSSNARDAEPVGYSFCTREHGPFYVPIRTPIGTPSLPSEEVHRCIRQLLESPTVTKIGQNLKYDAIVMRGVGIRVHPIGFDSMVADYLIDPGQRNHGLEDIAKRWLGRETISIQELIGSGKTQRKMDEVDVELVAEYACEDAALPLELIDVLAPRLETESLKNLFESLELPLIEVLAEMEFNGISVDVEHLTKLSHEFEARIQDLRDQIMSLAGCEFNPDSPKQLAKVLFEDLRLPTQRKTKTGQSTDVEVLQELADHHPLPAKLIEYRQATKLKSTYIDALPTLICRKTGRIHTSFRQDVAATGRLSSSEPNLQNIPIRSEEGRKIRAAFRPDPHDWILLTADYSQIELRVLAHFCGDESLRIAFEKDHDIHAMVASEVYGVSLADVSSSMRRNAKAINFGIIYGQSPFGLAKALSISKEDAAQFIDAYFAKYPGVQSFMTQTLVQCRNEGYVETIAGRKRWIRGVRDFEKLDANRRKILIEPERMAVNTVIQGSAADMIKMAMISLYRELQNRSLRARLLLQIHDELVFEVHPDDLFTLSDLVIDQMENVVPLRVPVKVEAKSGPNWDACLPLHSRQNSR